MSGNISDMHKGPRRIHILGGPASGKTFLARRLSEKMGIDHIDLDDLFWNNSAPNYNTRRNANERDRLLKNIIRRHQWLVEGVYHAWLGESFKKADIIIVLRVWVWLRHWRILRRFLSRRLSRKENARRETFANLWALLKWNHAYDTDNLRRACQFLTPHSHKVQEFSSNNTAYDAIVQQT